MLQVIVILIKIIYLSLALSSSFIIFAIVAYSVFKREEN